MSILSSQPSLVIMIKVGLPRQEILGLFENLIIPTMFLTKPAKALTAVMAFTEYNNRCLGSNSS